MTEFMELMLCPFLACVILTGIHAYLGVHVIEREVIFVDLALAQIAALGSTVGFLCGFGLHSQEGYLISLGFTLLGAAIFAASRFRRPVVPQEAIIGISYAVAAAASVLILSRAADGGEELKALMVGHLLFVDWSEIAKILCIYSLIAVIHLWGRRRFILISTDPETAFTSGMNVRMWDFLFYATFGVVVTSSVEIAGVLLVFSLLIVPAVCGVLLASSFRGRLCIGWVTGVICSMLGIWVSYRFDLPTGAAVVCIFGCAPPLAALIRQFRVVRE